MLLKKIRYSEHENKPNAWYLEELELENINLLVGKNATGKSRTLSLIAGLGNLLSGFHDLIFNSGSYQVEFEEKNEIYQYSLDYLNKNVSYEKLVIDGKIVLERKDDGSCEIFAKELKQQMKIKVPKNQIVALIRRDQIQHPYLEKLHDWAIGVRNYQFGTTMGRENILVPTTNKSFSVDTRATDQAAAIFIQGEKEFGKSYVKDVLNDLKSIGYNLDSIKVGPSPNITISSPSNFQFDPKYFLLIVKEHERNDVTYQLEMSQGMFRVLSLIIQIDYNLRSHKATTILIDDIGEGLDFDRSSGIIKLLEAKGKENNSQIIMSTNDKFVMNSVSLKYWQVIKRTNNKCRVYNYKNARDVFKEFEFTGLSNFDFLSTEFYESGFVEK